MQDWARYPRLLAAITFDFVSLSYILVTHIIWQRGSHSMRRAAFVMANLQRQFPNSFLFGSIRILVRKPHLRV